MNNITKQFWFWMFLCWDFYINVGIYEWKMRRSHSSVTALKFCDERTHAIHCNSSIANLNMYNFNSRDINTVCKSPIITIFLHFIGKCFFNVHLSYCQRSYEEMLFINDIKWSSYECVRSNVFEIFIEMDGFLYVWALFSISGVFNSVHSVSKLWEISRWI